MLYIIYILKYVMLYNFNINNCYHNYTMKKCTNISIFQSSIFIIMKTFFKIKISNNKNISFFISTFAIF